MLVDASAGGTDPTQYVSRHKGAAILFALLVLVVWMEQDVDLQLSYFWILLVAVVLAGGPLSWLAAWMRPRPHAFER